MLKIDQIEDIRTAKQVAILLEKENAKLHKKISDLIQENAKLKGQDGSEQLSLQIKKLEDQMAAMQRRLYGASSEKRSGGSDDEKKKEKQTGHGPRQQPELPHLEEMHEIPKEERICEHCKGELVEWEGQFEESEEITVVERSFEIKIIKRKKYRCKCGECIRTAPAPLKLIPGGRYSIDFAVEVAVQKYLDHLPLERQVRIMRRQGLRIDSQTLWDQIWALAQHLTPVYGQIPEYIYSREVIHADETRWYLLQKGGRKTWQVWAIASHDAVHYSILPSRSTKAGTEALQDYEGIVVCDGYKVYQKLAREGPYDVELAFCMAHVRRKFYEAEPNYPVECGMALDLIGKLYEIERQVPEPWLLEGEQQDAAFALRAKLRNEKSRPIAEELKKWALKQRGLPQEDLIRAVKYLLGHWDGLTKYLDNPKIPIDNNQAERTMRGPVLGRKNHYGSKSQRGTEVAAIFYSLLESAKLCGINPKTYLLTATKSALENPGSALMPHEMRD